MTKLELCQSVILNCAISGTMTTTIGQTGEFQRVVSWVDNSWSEIQTFKDEWDWMRSSVLLGQGIQFPTVAGQWEYALGIAAGDCGVAEANFGMWDRYTFRCYTTANGNKNDETFLDPISYDYLRDAYLYGAQQQVQTRPVAVAIGPNKSVCIGPPSNGSYTIEADYWVAPSTMDANASVPTGLPARFQMLIVYKAMMKYGFYESAPEVIQRADREYKTLFATLEQRYTPEVRTAGALA